MNDQTDQQLLRDFAEYRSEAPFTELVRRHVDLVHSAAFRMTCEPHSAQDVTQAVFVALAQNAARLTQHPVLSGWLHTTARNLAAKSVRATVRRQNHEHEAAAMNELLSTAPDASWEEIAPHLDAALSELSEPDRDAVLLRYFEKKSAAEIATRLGTSAETAQKRVSRAIERLRAFFAKRGISVGAGGLAIVISANAVQAAPAGLAAAISAAVLASAAVSTATVVAAATKTIAMTTLKKTLVTVSVVALAGVGIYQAHQAAQLRDQVQLLQQQQASLTEENKELKRQRNETLSRLSAMSEEIERVKSSANELLRLRGEVARLKAESLQTQRSTTNDSINATLNLWTARARQLKEYLNQNPKENIPEFEFLTDREWLFIAADAWLKTDRFEQPDEYRRAFESLRSQAQSNFGNRIQAAVQKYASDTRHDFPTDISQLLPYCEPVVAELMAQSYEVKNTDVFPPEYRKAYQIEGDLMITRKMGVNPDSPSRLAILPKGSAYWQTTWPKNSTNSSQ